MSIEKKAREAADAVGIQDLMVGWLRYEALRKLNVIQAEDLWHQAVRSDKSFDELVDELIENETRGLQS